MGKFEMHVHTAECDICAHVAAKDIVRMYHEKGYSGLVITDHYFAMSFDWFRDDLTEGTHREFIDRWLRGYREAKKEGDKIGMTVLLGAEVRLDGPNINDYLIYGIDEDFLFRAPYLNRLGSLQELIATLPENACVVQAHPFRDNMTVQNPNLLFGIEVNNGGTEPFRNDLAKTFAIHYKKPMLSGSDFHCADHLARGGIRTDADIQSIQDLVRVRRSGNYELI
jgi:predicted metal-dependent phosphoesterase TrpH